MSRFSATFEHSQSNLFETQELDALTASAEASRASRSASQGGAPRRATSAGYGLSSPELFARYDPDSRCWRTCRGYSSLFAATESATDPRLYPTFCETWPKWGLMRNGELFRLPTPERRIGESGSGLWPAPVKADGERQSKTYKGGNPTLFGATRQWPTPVVPNGGRVSKNAVIVGNTRYRPDGTKLQTDLAHAVRNWPTPRHEGFDAGAHRGKPDSLHSAVKQWPTPCTVDAKQQTLPPSQAGRGFLPGALIRAGESGALNPDWVELLVGLPMGWTDPDCDEPAPWLGWPAGPDEAQRDYEPPRVAAGIKHRTKRLKALGNIVVPQQAAFAWALVREILEGSQST